MDNPQHENLVRKYLKAGDVILVVGLMGVIEEPVFTGDNGLLICGTPTKEGVKPTGRTDPVHDVATEYVLRINGVPVEVLEFVTPKSRA